MSRPGVTSALPLDRFSSRYGGKRRRGNWSLLFHQGAKYYQCPNCNRRTLVRSRDLDAFNPRPSIFPPELQTRFPQPGTHQATYDFFCRGCARPVRVIYWTQEIGMGGSWVPLLLEIQELDRWKRKPR